MKLPSPTMRPVRHASTPEGVEQAAPEYSAVHQGSGTEETTRESTEQAFEAYGAPIKNVKEFKYLGRVLTANDDDWPAVVGNLGKARRSWGRLLRVLGREGAYPKVSRAFYTAVTQAVLLFGAETWVLTTRMEKALESFQSRVARKITGSQP